MRRRTVILWSLVLLLSSTARSESPTPPTRELEAASDAAGYRWEPFRPVNRPLVPAVKNQSWVSNPIDAFVAAEHEKRGLTPNRQAPRHVLLRRLYLDLIGLPPTREELAAFLTDTSPDAYEQVVAKLLDSPHYGERWGRHWMDVWRYADWAGYGMEVRESQRHIWRWRDWIIESLNADKGYDRMVLEMLAGDELAPTDPNTLRATGYLARNWYMFNRNVWLQNTVDHTAKAFLGVTLACARCHEHKYDPISQQEYYNFRAFFEPHDVRTDQMPGEPDLVKDGLPRVYDANAAAQTLLFVRGDEANPDKDHPLAPAVPAIFGKNQPTIQPVSFAPAAYYPGLTPAVQQTAVRQATAEIEKARTVLTKANEAVAAAKQQVVALAAKQREQPATVQLAENLSGGKAPAPVTTSHDAMVAVTTAKVAAVLAEKSLVAAEKNLASVQARIAADLAKFADPPAADSAPLALAAGLAERQAAAARAEEEVLRAEHELLVARRALKDGNEKTKAIVAVAEKKLADALPKLAAAFAAVDTPSSNYTPFGKIYPTTSTGRRLALAQWIADKQNPLTARVAVNHIWLRHFGSALVPTVFDFGSNGQPPTHPELLDWLAAELMDSGWSMKRMHRLMVTSSTYRMASDILDFRFSISDLNAPAATEASADADNRKSAIENRKSSDPDNRYLWRMNARRIEAEIVRDSVIHVGGQLDKTMGGPDLDQNAGFTSLRRSVYFRHAAEKQMLFLTLFDPAGFTECYRRYESVVPQQALALANSPLAFQQARVLAGRLAQQVGDVSKPEGRTAFVRAAFQQILTREPTPAEQSECESFLAEQAQRLADPTKLTAFGTGAASPVKPAADPQARARENLLHVLMNHNDFVMIR